MTSTTSPAPDAFSYAGPRASLRSSAGRGWKGFGAELLAIPAGVHRVPASLHHRVGVHVGTPIKARCSCSGQRFVRIQAHGDADVIPAGHDGEWTDEADCTILRIWIGGEFAKTTFEQLGVKPSHARIEPHFQLRDPRFQHLAWALRAELEADEKSDPLYAESLCTAMIVRLTQGASALVDKRRTLAPRMAARVIDYVESHLDQRLTLTELAALAELSVPHFKVLFRETLGMPVHRYVIERRVERARLLLLQGRLSASQVALETGFAHQSHMAHWMNRLLGVTPRELARSSAHAMLIAEPVNDSGDELKRRLPHTR
ncbi:helix-turn-helix domain-containing protein [Paraburkholderia sp.]|uniref:helix-turn-helix domain-containing protein n=1 Tax=Paraburkholderia sp. TaxID=1926495 RepID=UPI003D6DE002